jgi:SAM-dependent methyltransferase
MRQDERAPFDIALAPARKSAYTPGEFVGQESFMRASDILSLAVQAGVGPGASVLDLCCGVAGPGRLVTRRLGCDYLGVDSSASAVDIARQRSDGLGCRFEVADVPPLPDGPFDVVLLLETMLAFPDKAELLRGVSEALHIGGRFAFTLEEGHPLSHAERRRMPDADTVWLTPLPDLLACLERVGMRLRWQHECTEDHLETVDALGDAFAARATEIAAHVGHRAVHDLLTAHRLWGDWLGDGRVRKLALVAEKVSGPRR